MSITYFRGGEIPQPGDVNDECVRVLRDILERAESGQICGVVVVTTHSDSSGIGSIMGGRMEMLGIVGELNVVAQELTNDILAQRRSRP